MERRRWACGGWLGYGPAGCQVYPGGMRVRRLSLRLVVRSVEVVAGVGVSLGPLSSRLDHLSSLS
eukprot:COSAG04_NODE_146_length_22922_cov_53.506901_4_plen_65_part_00